MASSARISKRLASWALDWTGLLRSDLSARGTDTVIAVNYHGTPLELASTLRTHLAFYREYFECLNEDQVLHFTRGSLRMDRPGIVISFDDGLRDNATVAAPILDEFGMQGWFMVPGGFLGQGEPDQYFRRCIRSQPNAEHPAGIPAAAMTWNDLRALIARGHVVGCHTWSHCALGPDASTELIDEEVIHARQRMEDLLNARVRTFAWVRGRVGDYSPRAHQAIQRTYEISFMSMGQALRPGSNPLAFHRFNIEASYPLPVLRYQISRLNELAFAKRRHAVETIIR
jgi:peptidoglycan/xylan/chitin deacetylase (PgdA/CDA1 family)